MILWDARLIDGRGGPPIDHVVLRVGDGRIAAIETVDGRAKPSGAIDAAGRTIPPGLIDAQTHVLGDTERSPGSARRRPSTVRSLGPTPPAGE